MDDMIRRNNERGVGAIILNANTIAKWQQNGLFEDGLKAAAGVSVAQTGTKLHIPNLDLGELFAEIGEIIRYATHYDKSGRSSGSAEVVFARRSDAFQAFKRYNNVQLDGKPMKIEIIGAKAEIPLSARVNIVGAANRQKRNVVMSSGPVRSRGVFMSVNRGSGQRGHGIANNGRGVGGGRGHGQGIANNGRGVGGGRGHGRGGGGGRSRGGARWRKKTVEKSADELDKELENYHSEAMQS